VEALLTTTERHTFAILTPIQPDSITHERRRDGARTLWDYPRAAAPLFFFFLVR
jgi:hypothetical protein